MSADVVKFPGWTHHPIPVERVLQNTDADQLDYVLVLGITKDGKLYAASSEAGAHKSLFVAQRFAHKLLGGDFAKVPE